MIQLSVADLKAVFKDRSLYPEGSELVVAYTKAESNYDVNYRLVVGEDELIVGGWTDVTKAEANKMMCEDIVMALMSRGHFLLHNYVKTSRNAAG